MTSGMGVFTATRGNASLPCIRFSTRSSFFPRRPPGCKSAKSSRSEEHTSELQSLAYLVCRLLLEKKKISLRVCCQLSSIGEHHAHRSKTHRVHSRYSDNTSLIVYELGDMLRMCNNHLVRTILSRKRRLQLPQPIRRLLRHPVKVSD